MGLLLYPIGLCVMKWQPVLFSYCGSAVYAEISHGDASHHILTAQGYFDYKRTSVFSHDLQVLFSILVKKEVVVFAWDCVGSIDCFE